MRTNTIITLAASAAFGIGAVILARGWINDAVEDEFSQVKPVAVQTAAAAIEGVPVLVASRELGFGEALSRVNVRLAAYPADAVPEGAFTDFEQIFDGGSDRLALTNLALNEPILQSKVTGENGRASLSARITPGHRAVSVRVDDVTGVSGFLVPGDIVDVIHTRETQSASTGRYQQGPAGVDYVSDIILQKIKVLAVDQNQSERNASPNIAETITLEVTHQDGQRLALAMSAGTLTLSLRAVGETQQANARALKMSQMDGQKSRGATPSKRRAAPSSQSSVQSAGITVFRSGPDDAQSVERLSVRRQDDVNIVVYKTPDASAPQQSAQNTAPQYPPQSSTYYRPD